MLFDADSYDAWEEFLVGVLSRSSAGVTGALDTLASTGERLRAWTPQRGPLLEWTRAAVSAGATAPVPGFYDPIQIARRLGDRRACRPAGTAGAAATG